MVAYDSCRMTKRIKNGDRGAWHNVTLTIAEDMDLYFVVQVGIIDENGAEANRSVLVRGESVSDQYEKTKEYFDNEVLSCQKQGYCDAW